MHAYIKLFPHENVSDVEKRIVPSFVIASVWQEGTCHLAPQQTQNVAIMSLQRCSDVVTKFLRRLCLLVLFSYSKTSMTRTQMTRLPWLIRTRFYVLRKSSDSSRKQIFRDILGFFSNFIMKMYVVCTH